MAGYTEKRMYQRVELENQSPKVMYKKESNDVYNYARIVNYSNSGIYLKTNEYLDIGQHVILKMEDYDPAKKGPEKYDYYYGQIRWIKNFHTKPYDSSYGYGIEYDQMVTYD